MKLMAAIFVSLLMSNSVCADVYECNAQLEVISDGVEFMRLDTDKLTVLLKNRSGTFNGKITSIRKHNDGQKINLYLENTDPFEAGQNSEYIVFTWKNKYRVLGVNYIIEKGERVLDTLAGNNEIECKNKTK